MPSRPARLISRRADGTATVDTRGWMGGASRREILSIKPEILFLRAVSETSLKAFLTHSLASGVKGRTLVEGCQGAHSFYAAQTVENVA